MNKPLISLITVCYNAESLIADTLRSAVQQTYPHIELVIVDGASKDRTVEEAKKFEAHIGTLISESDKGIYDAMNKGISAAKGEWVYFLNAGDSFYDERVLEDLFSNKDLSAYDLLYAQVRTVNEPTGVNYTIGEPVTLKDFFNRYPICHQAAFFRRKAFEELGAYDTKYKLLADTEWFARFFSKRPEKAVYVNRLVAFYDIQGVSYHKRMKGYLEYMDFGRRHFPFAVYIKNYLMYPVIWLKVKFIRTFQHTAWFKVYRKIKFSGQNA